MSGPFPKPKDIKAPFVILALFFVLALAPRLLAETRAGNDLAVSFFDVGQGDAILIQSPYGQNILVDGGPDRTVLARLAEALPWWDRTIDLMVLTHPHDDHVAGLAEVLERYTVRRILYTGVAHAAPNYLRWLASVRDSGVPLVVVDRPQTLGLGEGLELKVLWPAENLAGQDSAKLNDTSIVLRLAYGRNSFLFTGDAERTAEDGILSRGEPLSSQVLKVPHHGSDTSLSPEFLTAVNPEIALISAGAGNQYGHPDPDTIRLLEGKGIKVLRTDREGTVTLISDGRGITYAKDANLR